MLSGYKTLTLAIVCTTESQSLYGRFAGTKYTVDVDGFLEAQVIVICGKFYTVPEFKDCIFNSEDGFKSRFQRYSDLLDELCPSHTVSFCYQSIA